MITPFDFHLQEDCRAPIKLPPIFPLHLLQPLDIIVSNLSLVEEMGWQSRFAATISYEYSFMKRKMDANVPTSYYPSNPDPQNQPSTGRPCLRYLQ
jgi:hypothetical protein